MNPTLWRLPAIFSSRVSEADDQVHPSPPRISTGEVPDSGSSLRSSNPRPSAYGLRPSASGLSCLSTRASARAFSTDALRETDGHDCQAREILTSSSSRPSRERRRPRQARRPRPEPAPGAPGAAAAPGAPGTAPGAASSSTFSFSGVTTAMSVCSGGTRALTPSGSFSLSSGRVAELEVRDVDLDLERNDARQGSARGACGRPGARCRRS